MWLVGQYRSGESGNVVWDFRGIFSTEEKAMNACRNENYFVHEVIIDEEVPDEPLIMECKYKGEF